MKKIIILTCLICTQLFVGQQAVFAQRSYSQKLAPNPPMGWNSWNWFGKDVNAKIIRSVIDSMAAKGLKEAGYEYIVVDGGWRASSLGPNGTLKVNKKFPRGMKALASYAHAKGFKFGLHTPPGSADCAGITPGVFGHEKAQIREYVSWGIDFIKLDKCRLKKGWNEKLLRATYAKWSRLLKKSGRDIILSCSTYKFRQWAPNVCQMSRTTGDINSKIHGGAVFDGRAHPHLSVLKIAEINNKYSAYAGEGYWNNPDMLVVGDQGLTLGQQKVHFGLWCIMSAPLMLGNDPRHMSPAVLDIVTNELAIAVDQDPTEQGTRIKVRGDKEIWAKQLKDGRQAVLMINRNKDEAKTITLNFIRLGITDKVQLKDIYGKKTIGTFTGSFSRTIEPQSGLFLLVKRVDE